jgi:hypothetical protein
MIELSFSRRVILRQPTTTDTASSCLGLIEQCNDRVLCFVTDMSVCFVSSRRHFQLYSKKNQHSIGIPLPKHVNPHRKTFEKCVFFLLFLAKLSPSIPNMQNCSITDKNDHSISLSLSLFVYDTNAIVSLSLSLDLFTCTKTN